MNEHITVNNMKVGDHVMVTSSGPDDLIIHEFSGVIIGMVGNNNTIFQVQDQDNNVWEVDRSQCEPLSE